MTGEVLDAQTALRVGLVTEVVEHERLLDRALELAALVADAQTAVLLDLKRMYVEGSQATVGYALTVEQSIADAQEHDWSTFEQRRVTTLEGNRTQLGTTSRS